MEDPQFRFLPGSSDRQRRFSVDRMAVRRGRGGELVRQIEERPHNGDLELAHLRGEHRGVGDRLGGAGVWLGVVVLASGLSNHGGRVSRPRIPGRQP